VPRIFWDLSTDRVLVMEYCEGGQVDDIAYMREHGISVNEVTRKLGDMYSEMIFTHGFVHCDPHPGNVLVTKDNGQVKIVLLDHGLYQRLTDEFRIDYAKLWLAMIGGDVEKIKVREIYRQTDRHRERERLTDGQKNTDTHTQADTQTDTQRRTPRHTDRHAHTEMHTQTETHTDTHTDRDRETQTYIDTHTHRYIWL
jgi:predicted unusual protein kinase regulating ubiquinone biosynthesis (AarF/ABC1/UbiB family)